MGKYNDDQINAISRMGRGVPRYNEGVLEMLGLGALAREFAARKAEVDDLADARDALADDGFDFILRPTGPQRRAQDRLDEAAGRMHAAWLPIQGIMDEAEAAS